MGEESERKRGKERERNRLERERKTDKQRNRTFVNKTDLLSFFNGQFPHELSLDYKEEKKLFCSYDDETITTINTSILFVYLFIMDFLLYKLFIDYNSVRI